MSTKNEMQSVNVMMLEYSSIRDELMKIHNRQQYNVIQGLVVIGALYAFIVSNWSSDYTFLLFFALITGLPVCCFTIILTAASTFARGRQLGHYICELEHKVSHCLQHETFNAHYKYNALEFTNWYFNDIKKPNRTIIKFDLITMMMFFFLVAGSSIYLSIVYIGENTAILDGFSYMLPYFILDFILLVIYTTICILALSYIKVSSDKVSAKRFQR